MSDVKVNQKEWDLLSQKEKDEITEGLKKAGTLGPQDVITGDASVPESKSKPLDLSQDLCRARCTIDAVSGIAWCITNTKGDSTVSCMAAVKAKLDSCLNDC